MPDPQKFPTMIVRHLSIPHVPVCRTLWLPLISAALFLAPAATPASAEETPPAPVQVATAEQGRSVQEFRLTGTVTAKRQARLSARTSGLMLKLHVDAGDRAKAGDVLAELDPALAQLALERITVDQERAEAELQEARRQLEEILELAKVGGFSKSEAQTRETTVQVREAALKQLAVQVREQKEIVARHKLLAPFSGVISQKLTEEGEWIQTGVPVVELVEVGAVQIDLQAPQEMFPVITPGTPVTLRLDAMPSKSWPAKIAALVPVKDPTARTFLVRLASQEAAPHMAPGMSAKAVFTVAGGDKVVTVPRDAVVRLADGTAKIWVVQGEGQELTAASREVKVAESLAENIAVLEGLDAGARVVVRGNETLREGQAVRILPENTTAVSGP
jgi:RND family efflux transporter MFP subunit